jgi:nicotinamide mononucleotide (NMN) deamidase PncC
VSEEVAREMAAAIREKRSTDFSLSVTGNLGPEPMEGKRVGLVYMAVDWERSTSSKGMLFEGEREDIKYQAALASLQFLNEVIETWA